MWIEGNYRRNLLDMHIDDWNEEFLSKVNPQEYVDALAAAGVQAAMVKAMPHTGLCNYPTGVGRMHKGLKGRDFFGEVLEACHKKGIAVIAYYSQIFDNYAAANHPEWQTVSAAGKHQAEYRNLGWFRNGRYGIVCPNNEEYRAYVKEHLVELNEKYDFEGMFLDMTFFPDVCYCEKCQERYRRETGKELPRSMDWSNPDCRLWQRTRERWIADFAAFTTKCIKDIHPECTIEHQMSMVASSWIHACSEDLSNQVDYTGGDYYGGFLQQSFINKFYRNITPNLPFVYHTSRCDPALEFHTTTKSREELLLHVITALVHNGAFLLVDAINPDGSIVPDVYRKLMKSIYSQTKPFEEFVGGRPVADVAIWFNSNAKFDPNEKCDTLEDKNWNPDIYMDAPVHLASILRENNIPFDVIGSKNLKACKAKVIALSHMALIEDKDMEVLENYVREGGKLYVSGPIGHERLAQLLGVAFDGVCAGKRTQESFTYLDPTQEGQDLLEGFDALAPLSVPMSQYRTRLLPDAAEITVFATRTLPYTVPGSPQFSAIHSNPPGIHTGEPAVFERKVGKGSIFYCAAPLELSKPYMSRQVVGRMMKYLVGMTSYSCNAPKMVECYGWEKSGALFMALLNEQEEPPFIPVHDIQISVEGYKKAYLYTVSEQGERMQHLLGEVSENENLSVTLPPLSVFHIVKFTND